jgi:predicted molibdopterin-dependent oxidoreductase YjgC
LQPSTHDEAAAYVAARLRDIAATHGAGAIAFLGGEKLNVEEQYLFQKLARGVLGTNHVDARTRFTARVSGAAVLKATGGGRPGLTFEQLTSAQEVLVLFDDLQGESPFAQANIIRGQHQRGLHVTVAHPRRVKLARPKFKGDWLGVKPGAELVLLHALTQAALAAGEPANLPAAVAAGLPALKSALAGLTPERIEAETGVTLVAITAAAKRLQSATRKAVLFGRAATEHPQAAQLLQAIENLGWATGAITAESSSILYAGPQHDSQGALDMGLTPDMLPGYVPVGDAAGEGYAKAWGRTLDGKAGLSAPEILAATAEGRIKALWIVGDHWLNSAPDRALAEKAIATAELVIVNELFFTETAQQAHVVFPVAAFAEKEGTVVNCERRLQKANRALSPRRGSKADWEVFQSVAQSLGADWRYRTPEDIFREIARLVPGYSGLNVASLLPNGITWSTLRAEGSLAASLPAAAAAQADTLALVSGGTLFAQGSLTNRTPKLAELAKQARAALGLAEASRLGLQAGDTLEITGPGGSVSLPAELDDSVPAGAVFVPYALPGAGLNRLGMPSGSGLRVKVRKTAAAAKATAQGIA